MINTLLGKVFGTKNERELKRLMPQVEAISALEPQMQQLSDEQLRAKTDEFRQRIQERLASLPDEPDADPDRLKQLEDERTKLINEALDELLVEAFAVVREAGRRVLNMRHFDVQLIGGMVLHQGKIAEMKTGEGKTLVATLPVYLNALSGRGVHVVTVNDYLAKRDSEWMGKLYRFLGLTVGVIVHDLDDEERREAYASDVTYGTNNEFGFDYLRDNMKFDVHDCVQRKHNFAIVDEVDSILIDEARTPLIISGASEESTDKYARVNRIIPKLEKGEEIDTAPGEPKELTGDYVVDEKHKSITVTDVGWEKVEQLLGIGNIADPENWDLKHHVDTAVKAHALVQARRRVRSERRRSHHRGRVHRPPDAGPPLVGWPAPGGRSQGKRQDRAREPDPGHHHLPELFPHVQEAGRHDRHGGNRSRGIRKDLPPGSDGDSDQQGDAAVGKSGCRLSDGKGKVLRRFRRNPETACHRTPGAGGHHFHRKVGAAFRTAEEEKHQARRAQCQVSRARSRDRGPGRDARAW